MFTIHRVDGPEGCGKSTVLLQLAELIRLNGTIGDQGIILYEPNTSRFTHGYLPYYPAVGGENEFEQPELGADLIAQMVELSPKAARDLPVDPNDESLTLGKLSEQLAKNPLDGHKAFLKVLRALKQGQVPVYFLLDEINCLFGPTQYKDPDSKRLTIDQLPLLKALRTLYLNPVRTIQAIGAFCHSDPLTKKYELAEKSDNIATLTVPDMTVKESAVLLEGLKTIGYVPGTIQIDRRYLEHKHVMTGGNARLLYEAALYDDIYN